MDSLNTIGQLNGYGSFRDVMVKALACDVEVCEIEL